MDSRYSLCTQLFGNSAESRFTLVACNNYCFIFCTLIQVLITFVSNFVIPSKAGPTRELNVDFLCVCVSVMYVLLLAQSFTHPVLHCSMEEMLQESMTWMPDPAPTVLYLQVPSS